MNQANERREVAEKLRRARDQVNRQQLPAAGPAEAQRPPLADEQQRLHWLDQVIQEAMAAGEFDNLPGQGKPLHLETNPYADPADDFAYRWLKNSGFVPDWLAREQEIDRELAAARSRLHTAWRWHQANPGHGQQWQAALARFEAALLRLNRQIDDFNLIVPIVSRQRARLRLEDELRRLSRDNESRDSRGHV